MFQMFTDITSVRCQQGPLDSLVVLTALTETAARNESEKYALCNLSL